MGPDATTGGGCTPAAGQASRTSAPCGFERAEGCPRAPPVLSETAFNFTIVLACQLELSGGLGFLPAVSSTWGQPGESVIAGQEGRSRRCGMSVPPSARPSVHLSVRSVSEVTEREVSGFQQRMILSLSFKELRT